MKIQSEKYINCELNFYNQEVKFNREGVSEVEDSLGLKMIEDFPSSVWEFNKKPKQNIKKEEKIDSTEVANLKFEISRLQMLLNQKTAELVKSREMEKVWRDEVQRLMDGGEKNEDLLKEPLPTEEGVTTEQSEGTEEDLSGTLLSKLNKMKAGEVKIFYTETINKIQGEELEKLTKKEVIDLILAEQE